MNKLMEIEETTMEIFNTRMGKREDSRIIDIIREDMMEKISLIRKQDSKTKIHLKNLP